MALFDDSINRLPNWGEGIMPSGGLRDQAREFRDTYLGNGSDPGMLGMGRKETQRYTPDANAAQMPTYQQWQQQLAAGAAGAGGRAAPMASAAQVGQARTYGGATIDPSQQAQFRQGQMGLVQQLQAQSRGEGPSVAQGQLQQATDRNLAQALAMANATGANSGGAGMRALAATRAAASQQAASDSAILRAQEQLAAQNQLGQVLAGARGQDIGLATEQAGLTQQAGLANMGAQNEFALQQAMLNQQTGLANQQSQLAQTGMNDKLVQYYTSAGLSLDEAQRQAAMEMERMKLQGALGFEGLDSQNYATAAGNRVNQSQFYSNWLRDSLASLGKAAATGGVA